MSEGVISGKVVDCTTLSSTFPNSVPHEISRDAILNLVDEFFSSDIQLVTLDGKPDVGKTRIMAQFALRRPSNTITVFIKPNSWFMQEPGLLYADIASQIYWALNEEELTDPHSANEPLIRQLSFDLQRLAKRTGQMYYFLIDGMEDVTDGLAQFAGTLMAVLPLEYANFRFMFTGDAKWVPKNVLSKLRRKDYPVPGLTLEETIAYFDGCDLQRIEAEELYKSCSKGTPGYLASARRLIDAGMPASKLIEQLPESLPSPFQLEWQAIENAADQLFNILAVLSFDTNPHSVADLAALFETDPALVRKDLSSCGFVELPSTDDSPVTYVSTSFRRFAAEKLSTRRNAVWERLAQHLLAQTNTDKALDLLPSYLEKAGRPQELLGVLSPTSFLLLVERTDSFIPLQRQSLMGLDTSVKLKRLGEALRFGVQLAAIADVSTSRLARAEVRARLAIGDYETALALAQSAVLKHHRLQLLAAIARFQRERGLTPETTVLESLDRLANQIDLREIGDDIVELASDLMYSRPELAMKVISSVGPRTSDDRSMDWALVRLSIAASINRGSESADLSATVKDLRSRIKDPVARRFSSAISLVVGNYTPAEVLTEVNNLESVGDRIFLLREWCTHTRTPEKAAEIIDYAVHLAIRTTAYSPTAKDFRDLALPLPKIIVEQIPALITAFDIQREAARRIGPTQDYVQLQLLLAEAEGRVSQRNAGQRLLQTYYDVRDIADLETRIVCTGLLVAASPRIDPGGAFEDTADVRKVSEVDFVDEVRALLRSTADHYVISRRIIEAVAISRPELAMQIANELNVQSRRDDALKDVVEQNLVGPVQDRPLEFLESVLGKFGDVDTEDEVVQHVLVALGQATPILLKELVPKISKYLERACTILNPTVACEALSSALVILHKTGRSGALTQQVESALSARWESMGDPSEKLEAGYDIVVALADCARETAGSYLRTTDELKAEHTGLTGTTYMSCLRLAIRAFSGLLPRQLESSADFERLTLQIERVPSRLDRVWLWSELAMRCFINERSDDGKRVVNQKIRPLLDKLREPAEFDWRQAVTISAPALYEVNSVTALDVILALPSDSRDTALDRVLRFRMTNVPSGDPFEVGEDAGYNIDFSGCLEILKLVEHFDVDVQVYRYIESVASSAVWRHNRHQFTETQKNEIAQTIRAVASKKFPSPKWIKHEGFAILADAQAFRLLREKTVDWRPLVQRARSLPNDSDRVFVLAYLAQCMHGGHLTEKLALLREAKAIAENIPSTYDRVERLRLLASVARDIDIVLARSLIVDAMRIVKNSDNPDASEARRRLVDFAYQLDPDLASSLASSLDDDAARNAARRRIEYQKLKSDLLDSSDAGQVELSADEDDYAQAAWELLGYLNAGRAEPRDVAQTLKFVRIAGDQALTSAFPIFSWVIENAIVRRAHAEEAKRMVREMFEATMSASEIAAAVVSRAIGQAVAIPTKPFTKDHERIIIPADQRERAIDYFERWLIDHGKEYLKICDPYFGPKDLDVLKIVLSVAPDLGITIVNSRKQQEQEKVEWPWDDFYMRYWQKHFSGQVPPRTEIVVVAGRAGELPVHDRWWLTNGAGLRLGSSFGGIGKSRDSEISILTDSEVAERSEITDSYITRSKREHRGEKLTYQSFFM
jgi:hypothetical protein